MSSETIDAVAAEPRSSTIASLWQSARKLFLFLVPLRFSFLALIVVAFAFLASAQGYDIIAHIAEDDPTGATPPHTAQRIGFVLGVMFLALQTWYWSRQLLHNAPAPGHPRASEYPWLTTWLPRIFGVAAFVIAIGSLWRVARRYGVDQPVEVLRRLAVMLAIALLAFLAFVILRRRYVLRYPTWQQRSLRERDRMSKWMMSLSLIAALALFLQSTFFVQSTVSIGSATIVLFAFALAVPIGSVLVWLGTRRNVPVFTFLLLWAVLISPLADNHVVETLPGDVHARPTVAASFDRWFERLRAQHPPAADGRYPVFLVATEGGGIRAAYWTAAVMTSLSDTIPTFTDHLFALSAVSGGALGSTVYEALLIQQNELKIRLDALEYTPQMGEQNESSLRLAASQMLAEDSLAPTLAAMTNPDLLQRFLPIAILPDRERALEGGWERAWRTAVAKHDGTPDDSFAGGFLAMMKGREATLPSLFLNGTVVETGQRVIATNLNIENDGPRAYELAEAIDLFDAIGGDVRVSTAVANSTRFTYVSPAGTLRRAKDDNGGSPLQCAPGERCEHVVDGGYFENSGCATASDLLDIIRRSKYRDRVRPHVIVISFRNANPAPIEGEKAGNEVLSPLRALLSVRGAHADLAEEELKTRDGVTHTVFQLVQTDNVFPLGWLLADHTRTLMDVQMGPKSKENGASVTAIATLLGQQNRIGRDGVQELAARRLADPKFQE